MRTNFPSFVVTRALLAALAVVVIAPHEFAQAQQVSQPAALPARAVGTALPRLNTLPDVNASVARETPEQLIVRATAAFEQHRSFSARLRHNVQMFGQNLVGKGTYHQLGDGLNQLLRVEMTVKAAGQGSASQLAHVCDGRYLWMFEEVGGKSKLSRIDLRRVNLAMERAKEDFAEPVASPSMLAIGSGGLGRLLSDLHEQFEMHAVREATLSNDPVWILDGRWRTERLAKMLPKQADAILAGKPPKLDKLARHLPHEVQLTLSRDDSLLPYRVEFAQTKYDEQSGTTERNTIVAMDIYEIKVNEPLDPQLFVYKPGSVEIVDRTEKFLVQHGLLKGKEEEEENE